MGVTQELYTASGLSCRARTTASITSGSSRGSSPWMFTKTSNCRRSWATAASHRSVPEGQSPIMTTSAPKALHAS